MPLSPQVLLSGAIKARCVANLKQLPALILFKAKRTTNASVLVPLCNVNGEVSLLYTLRSSNMNSHSGQVSFPGGKMDENESVVETALRETEEEIGITRDNIDIWSPMNFVQGKYNLITPVVGLIKDFDMSKLKSNLNEVDEVFTVPLSMLCDPSNHAHLAYNPPVPVYLNVKHTIWGLTGFITHMFLECFLTENDYKVNFLSKKLELNDLMPSKVQS